MATLECDHETVGGVTLVECRLASDVPERVTVEPTHDGPIWPPRRHGVPAAGWSPDGWSGRVPADGYRALGYATPTDPGEEPVRIAATAPPEDDGSVSAREVIRSLGDPTPTRDAVPAAAGASDPTTDAASDSATNAGSDAETLATATDDGHADAPGGSRPTATRQGPNAVEDGADTATARAADLDAIETRLWTARDLADVSTVEEARAAVKRAGGMAAVRSLSDRLAADRERLAALEERTGRLAREAEAVEVPVDSLERLV